MSIIPIFSWAPSGFPGRALRLSAIAGGVMLAGFVATAQPAPKSEKKTEVTNETSALLAKIKPVLEDKSEDAAAKNIGRILGEIDPYLATLSPKSFDYAYVSQYKFQALLLAGRHIEAIQPMEASIREGFFDSTVSQQTIFYIGTLYFQDAMNSEGEALRKEKLLKARTYLENWFKDSTEPPLGSPEMQRYAAGHQVLSSILFQLGEYKQALVFIEKLIRLSVAPDDRTWILLFACQQQAGMPELAAETFELFLEKFPGKKEYWPQLAQAYLASDQKLRAIFTYERAQSKGAMIETKDYDNLFNLYYMIEEYARAAELLTSWIKSRKVLDSEENWERVSLCYQNLRRDDEVREVLETAAKKFQTGNLDFQLAQYLWYDGKYAEGMKAALLAWKKGKLKRPGRAALFLAVAYLENRDPPLARQFLDEAIKQPGADKKDLERVKKFVEIAYAEWQERQKTAAEAAKKS